MLDAQDPCRVKHQCIMTGPFILSECAAHRASECIARANDLWILCKYNYCNLQLRDPNLDVCLCACAAKMQTQTMPKWCLFRNCILEPEHNYDRSDWLVALASIYCDENFKRQLTFEAESSKINSFVCFGIRLKQIARRPLAHIRAFTARARSPPNIQMVKLFCCWTFLLSKVNHTNN